MSNMHKQIWLTTGFSALKTLIETTLKDITHRITRLRGDTSTKQYVKLLDKDTKKQSTVFWR